MNISGFEKASRISGFRLQSAINGHTFSSFDAVFNGQDADSIISMADERKKVTIKLSDNTVVMNGFVLSVEGEITKEYAYLHVTIVSSSWWAEESYPEKRRIYQDTKKDAQSIIEYINSNNNHSKCSIQTSSSLSQMRKEIPNIIVQDKSVNDHSFSKYICALNEYAVVTKYDDDVIKVIKPGEEMTEISLDRECDRFITNLKGVFKLGYCSISFSSLKKIMPGTAVKINGDVSCYSGRIFIVSEMTAVLNGEYLLYTYKADENIDFSKYLLDIPDVIAETGIVSDKSDRDKMGRIQVGFSNCEDIGESGNRYWISYLTPFVGENNNGFIMLPDVNDRVCVLISSGKGWCVGSERSSEIQSEYTDVDKLYIVYGKEIFSEISADGVMMKNSKDTSLELTKEKISAVQGVSELTLDKDSVSIRNDSNSSVNVKKEIIELEQNNSSVALKKDNITLSQGDRKETLDSKAIILSNSNTSVKLESGKATIKSSKIDFKSSM